MTIYIFKTSPQTLPQVIKHAKHAFQGAPKDIQPGDLILISQTGVDRKNGEKPIRWLMDYVTTYEDTKGESEAIWGKHWRYIVQAKNARQVEPFDIQDIQVSDFLYGAAQSHTFLRPDDELEVRRYLAQETTLEIDEREDWLEDLETSSSTNFEELIARLDQRYRGTPKYRSAITRRLTRPTRLRDAILARDGTTCRLCGTEGFLKKSGGRYAEVHHMIELNQLAPDTMQSWNVIVVCPTCHRKLHYAPVKTKFLDPGWLIEVDGQTYTIEATK